MSKIFYDMVYVEDRLDAYIGQAGENILNRLAGNMYWELLRSMSEVFLGMHMSDGNDVHWWGGIED